MATVGMSPSGTHRTHVRDGIGLICLGAIGWGVAPLAGHPGLAVPILLLGVLAGVATIAFGSRAARRAELVSYLTHHLAPLLGASSGEQAAELITPRRWTYGWPGRPRRLKLCYRTGRAKVATDTGDRSPATLEFGDNRWVRETGRELGRRLGGVYKLASNDPVRGRATFVLDPDPDEPEDVEDPPSVDRAKRLVNELLAHTATFDKVEVDDSGAVRGLEVHHEVGSKLVSPGYRARVERTVSVMLPGRWRAKWDMEGDKVTFEVRPTLPESLWIPPLGMPDSDPLKNYRGVQIPYGIDEDGEIIYWNPAVTPMWLIVGGTGSGKTSTMLAILTRITQYGWPVWIADGKGTSFLGYRDWPNVQIVASRIEQQVAVIHRAHQLMEYRYNLVVDGRARTEDFEPLILFVDEFTVLKGKLMTWYAGVKQKGDPAKPPTLGEIGDIARMGREGRVHMVFGLQRGDAEILTGEVRENFGQRTSLGQISPDSAQMMWNNPVTGVTIPRGKVGRAIGTNAQGVPVEMQAYRVPDVKDITPDMPEWELSEKLRPPEAKQERLLIVPPDLEMKFDPDGNPIPVGYFDYAGAEWVRAADRPDLDPLAQRRDDTVDGRALSSPLAALGLAGTPAPEAGSVRPSSYLGPLADAEPDGEEDVDMYADGYGQPVRVPASNLRVGDLVQVDPEADAWAVVDEEPMPDFDDDRTLVISWRDDQDESGQLIVPAEAMVDTRRPTDLAA